MARSLGRRSRRGTGRRAKPAASEAALRQHLVKLLEGGEAHVEFDRVVEDLPAALRGAKPAGAPHTPWQLVEHIRIAQWDILEFSRSPGHVSPKWPEGYWPKQEAPPDGAAWKRSLEAFRRDRREMIRLVKDPGTNLLAPIPHGQGQSVFRQVLLAADHTAYHLGQLVLLRRLLGAWGEG
jgi:DinB superfamily